jgi:anti-sigma B factor antagonist
MFDIKKTSPGTIVLEGRLDAAQEEKARAVLDGLDDTTVLDCKDLSYIASSGLGVLLRAQKKLQAQDKTLRIVNLNPHLREIFKMVSFDRIFQLE